MIRIKKHRTRRKSRHPKENKVERFLNSKLFMVLGIVFILIGLVYSIASSKGENSFINLLASLLKPSDDSAIVEVVNIGFASLLLYFLPLLFSFVATLWFAKRHPWMTYAASILVTIYLIGLQAKLFWTMEMTGSYYPNLLIASIILVLSVSLLLSSSFFYARPALPILICSYFYLSLVLNAAFYGTNFEILFLLALLFSICIAWLSNRIHYPIVNLFNFFFVLGFFGLFWLRKFVVNSKPDFLPVFFIFGFLFYLVFYAISVYASSTEVRPLKKWLQVIFTGANNLFYLGTTSYVLLKYYEFGYLWIFGLAVLLLNLLGLYVLTKNIWKVWLLPRYYSVMILAALVIPLLVHQNMILLFAAGLSGLMLRYACDKTDRVSMWFSAGALVVTLISFLVLWGFRYLPALFSDTLPEGTLLWNGIISMTAVMGLLIATQIYIGNATIPFSKRWFRQIAYVRIVFGVLLFALFISQGWLVFSLVCLLSHSTDYITVSWFISGAVFFIAWMVYYSGKKSFFKKSIFYLAVLFALFYPVLVHLNMVNYRDKLIHHVTPGVLAPVLHYLALILLIQMGYLSIRYIYLHHLKNRLVLWAIQIITVLFLGFLLCTEFDNLSILLSRHGLDADGKTFIGAKLLVANQYLPWSILLWILAVLVFIRGVYFQELFLKNLAIFMFPIILIKLFAYDFEHINEGSRSVLFISLGIFLIAFAFFYRYLQKQIQQTKNNQLPGKEQPDSGMKREE